MGINYTPGFIGLAIFPGFLTVELLTAPALTGLIGWEVVVVAPEVADILVRTGELERLAICLSPDPTAFLDRKSVV